MKPFVGKITLVDEDTGEATILFDSSDVVNSELTLVDRFWTCACGVVHDRDKNASVNLKNLATGSSPCCRQSDNQ